MKPRISRSCKVCGRYIGLGEGDFKYCSLDCAHADFWRARGSHCLWRLAILLIPLAGFFLWRAFK